MATTCIKCHRPLTDPISQAIGMGPECRGDSGRPTKHTIRIRNKRARAHAYSAGLPIHLGTGSDGQPTVYEFDGKGTWTSNHAHQLSHELLGDYLLRYGWIRPEDLQEMPA